MYIVTIKFLFTEEEAEKMKAEQNLTNKIKNLRSQKRRNDAEDRAIENKRIDEL